MLRLLQEKFIQAAHRNQKLFSMKYSFPLYRKSKNGKNFYKITSIAQFEEIKIIGSKAILHQTEAVQFPEKNYLMDLIETNPEYFEISSQEEYSTISEHYNLV